MEATDEDLPPRQEIRASRTSSEVRAYGLGFRGYVMLAIIVHPAKVFLHAGVTFSFAYRGLCLNK